MKERVSTLSTLMMKLRHYPFSLDRRIIRGQNEATDVAYLLAGNIGDRPGTCIRWPTSVPARHSSFVYLQENLMGDREGITSISFSKTQKVPLDKITMTRHGSISHQAVLETADAIGFTIPDKDVADYAELLEKTKKTYELVSSMDDYQPEPDFEATPRRNVHFPTEADNPLNAWAWKVTCRHDNPTQRTLEGKTVCVKDNIAMAGVPCLLGTDTFTGWTPVTDATVITRVLDHGGTISGKAVCENLSRGAVSVTAATGPVHNPYGHGYSAGGSSSGTAALVASGAADMGIGCDQGGSIRIPAALCGLWGMKATLGLVPYSGIASNDASVDYVGPITRSCMDCAVLLEALAGADGMDDRQIAGTPSPEAVPRYAAHLISTQEQGVKGMKIGIVKEAPNSTQR